MKHTDLRPVAVLVLWITSLAFLISTVIGVNAAIHALFPSLAAYADHPEAQYSGFNPVFELPDLPDPLDLSTADPTPRDPPTPAELDRLERERALARQNEYTRALFRARHSAIDTLVTSLSCVAVSFFACLGILRCLARAATKDEDSDAESDEERSG